MHVAKRACVAQHLTEVPQGVSPDAHRSVILDHYINVEPALLQRLERQVQLSTELSRHLRSELFVEFMLTTRGPTLTKRLEGAAQRQAIRQRAARRQRDRGGSHSGLPQVDLPVREHGGAALAARDTW
jgi:hypothetical protein